MPFVNYATCWSCAWHECHSVTWSGHVTLVYIAVAMAAVKRLWVDVTLMRHGISNSSS